MIILTLAPFAMASKSGANDAVSLESLTDLRQRSFSENAGSPSDLSIDIHDQEAPTYQVQRPVHLATTKRNKFNFINGNIKLTSSLISIFIAMFVMTLPKNLDVAFIPALFFILVSDFLLPTLQSILSFCEIFPDRSLRSARNFTLHFIMNLFIAYAGLFRVIVVSLFYAVPGTKWQVEEMGMFLLPSLFILALNMAEKTFDKSSPKLCCPEKQSN